MIRSWVCGGLGALTKWKREFLRSGLLRERLSTQDRVAPSPGPVDGTPVKRIFWSIISDYDLKTGLCELVDNAIDLWTLRNREKALNVTIVLDSDRQLVTIQDGAGGITGNGA